MRVVSEADFGELVCSVYLQPLLTVSVGNAPLNGCPANFRGVVTITNTIILHDQGTDTWNRGFDGAGTQVWGATDRPYQFRWQQP